MYVVGELLMLVVVLAAIAWSVWRPFARVGLLALALAVVGTATAETSEPQLPIAPQVGPQQVFAECSADIAIFGGSAGGGKSYALLYEAVKWTALQGVRGYRAVIFRRTQPELTGGGGLWDETQELYRAFGGRPRGAPALDWTFEAKTNRIQDRHRVELRHLQYEETVHEHQGRQYAFIGFDELTHFTARQFWYMVSRLRSMSGVRPYLRATCNPDPDSFVAELVAWWIGEDGYAIPERSGVVRWFIRDDDDDALVWFDSEDAALAAHPGSAPISFTFIASLLADNQALLRKDPTYERRLRGALVRVDRLRLLGDGKRGGNWHVRDSAGLFFQRADFVLVDEPPAKILQTVRAWDKAASVPTAKHPDPDWTEGVRVSLLEGGSLYVDDLESMRARPVEVLTQMRRTAEGDGRTTIVAVYQDTGGAGKTDAELTRDALTGFAVEIVDSFAAETRGIARPTEGASRAKRALAKVWAPLVEQRRVYIKRAAWTERIIAQCDAFPDGGHDDIVDAISAAAQVLIGQGLGFWSGFKDAAKQWRQP